MIVGVLGGGQLGRMLALAGVPLGIRFRFLESDPTCPARDVGELVTPKSTVDNQGLAEFVRGVDVVTYEFENVAAETARWLTEHVPVYPPEGALAIAQDRLSEKECFAAEGIEPAPHARVDTEAELREAVQRLGVPAILKTRRFGYDGKGQWVIRSVEDIENTWKAASVMGLMAARHTGGAGLILEGFVAFRREISMLGVRGRDGECRFYPPVWNTHERGILSRSVAPAPEVSMEDRATLEEATARVMERLKYVGVLAVEYFDLGNGRFIANEMAPRVHNSGHWTIEGSVCSQFENHVRAISGLPLGLTDCRGHSVMLNIVGGQPDLPGLLRIPGAHVHMYGKSPRSGRKLGHVTVCAEDARGAADLADRAARSLRNC